MTNIEIPNSVTYIGSSAFYDCSSLKSIKIPNSITTIENSTFNGCVSLTNIEIPNSVTYIGNLAFQYCTSLTSIVIPASVNSIGSYAFYMCVGLTSIEIPNSLTKIEDDVFAGCGFTSITIPNSVTSIGDNAFDMCVGLTSIEIPNSVITIGNNAFQYCTSLTSIVIPASVDSIGDKCFNFCFNLTEVSCQAVNPPTLGSDVFMLDVAKLNVPEEALSSYKNSDWVQYFTNFTKPNLVAGNKIESGQFKYTVLNAETKTVELTGLTVDAKEISGNIIIPETVQYNDVSYSVTEISGAFSGCRNLTSITIPNSVTKIGNNAFSGCRNLTSITIPNSVTRIGNSAFFVCESLTSITIPNSVTEIENSAFFGCGSLTSITIPNSVTDIGTNCFSFCTRLTEVTCRAINPPTLKEDAFPKAFATLNFPEEALSSYQNSDWAHYFANLKKQVLVTGDIFTVGQFSYSVLDQELRTVEFNGPTVPTEKIIGKVIIPETAQCNDVTYSVTSIGANAFYDYSGLTNIEIPNSINEIKVWAFTNCSSLTSIVIPNSITKIESGVFQGCKGLTSIEIPTSVTTIGDQAFMECSGLTNVVIPNSVDIIQPNAFKNCSTLTRIELPASLTLIRRMAFAGCNQLTNITCYAVNPPTLGDDVFAKGFASLNVPEEALSSYQDSDWAQYFTTIKKLGPVAGDKFETTEFGFTILDAEQNTVALTSVVSITGEAVVPETVLYNEVTYTVNSIGECAFSSGTGLKSIEIPASVTSIGDNCFKECTQLTTVTCKAVTPPALGTDAFVKDIATITVPEEALNSYMESDWAQYFENLRKHEPVAGDKFETTEFGFTILDTELNTVALTSVVSATGNVTVPETVSYNDVTYNVTEIGEEAFCNQSAITVLRLPDCLTVIPKAMCAGCTGLEKIYFSDKVTSFGESAFRGCSSLRSMIVPDGVTEIPASMLQGCTSLTEILIPNSVTKIGERAFSGCSSLKNVDLGTGVYDIANYAFENCNKITDLHCMASNPPYAEIYSFSTAAYKDVTVTVKEQSLSKYNRENPWYRFENYLTVAGAVSLSHYEVEMAGNEVFQLGVYGSEKQIVWTSSNPSVAYANECGLIVAMGITGTTTISANVDGEKVDCRVNVTALKRTPQAAPLSRAGDEVESNEPTDIILESIGGNPPMVNVRLVPVGSSTVIDWTSSDNSLATVENGLITVHHTGEVNFGVETENGLEETLAADTEELKTSGMPNGVIMESTTVLNNNVYDLNGRCILMNATPEQIKSLRKGIYIVNGKKLLVK